jgi:hypothetical protein
MGKVVKEDPVRRAKLKMAAFKRAEFNLKVAMERIDYNLDVIEPAVKQIALDSARGEITQFAVETS